MAIGIQTHCHSEVQRSVRAVTIKEVAVVVVGITGSSFVDWSTSCVNGVVVERCEHDVTVVLTGGADEPIRLLWVYEFVGRIP